MVLHAVDLQQQQLMILTETKSKQLIKSRYLSDTYAVERDGVH